MPALHVSNPVPLPRTRPTRVRSTSFYAVFLIFFCLAGSVCAKPAGGLLWITLSPSNTGSSSSSTPVITLPTLQSGSQSSGQRSASSSIPSLSLSSTPSLSLSPTPSSSLSSIVTSTITSLITVTITTVTLPMSTMNTPSSTSTSTSVEATGTLLPVPHTSSSVFARNPGALAGLIIGIFSALAAIFIYAWFTWRRHRLRQLEGAVLNEKVDGADQLPTAVRSIGRRSVLDDHRSSTPAGTALSQGLATIVERENGASSLGYNGSWITYHRADEAVDGYFAYSPSVPDENGYGNVGPVAASSNGHGDPSSSHGHASTYLSSHGHGALSTGQVASLRAQSPPSAWPGDRSVTPTAAPSAWLGSNPNTPGSRPLSRSSSAGSSMGMFNRVNSDASNSGFNPGPPSIYPYLGAGRDLSQPFASPPASPTLISHPPAAVLNPPSSLLRPPSTTPPNPLTLSPSPSTSVYMHLPNPYSPSMTQQHSPATSEVSVASGREGLLHPPGLLGGETHSFHSLRDEIDYSRRIGGIVNNDLRYSFSTTTDSFTEHEDNPSQYSQ